MAVVAQTNHMTHSAVPMDAYKPHDHQSHWSTTTTTTSSSSSLPRSLSPTNSQEDTFRQMILEKIEEGKRDINPRKCQQILDDLMKMLKHLTADVNNYNLAFRETRPSFYLQEFKRLTDRIDILTKARDTLTEYLHELDNQNVDNIFAHSSSINDVASNNEQLQYSPIDKSHLSSNSKDVNMYDDNDQQTYPISTPILSPQISHSSQPLRSASMSGNTFIRVHFPNKHTTVLAPRHDETLNMALELPASRHAITNLKDYTPVYMISRQPCPWDITLDRVLETEIELEEKPKLDHSFIRKTFFTLTYCDACHKLLLKGVRCLVCDYRIHVRCIHQSCLCRFQSRSIFDRHIKFFGSSRYSIEQTKQSRSLSRFPLSRPNNHHGTGSQKNNQDSHNIVSISNADNLPNVIQSTSSNSFFQLLPSSTSYPYRTPQSLLTINELIITNSGNLPPNITKLSNDGTTDVKKAHRHVSEWEIRSEDLLNRRSMVGRGTYGTVYKAEVRLHGLVALKELNFVSPTPSQFQAFRNEVIALKKITHQNTLNFYGYILSPRFAIVTQWCEGSTLYKHIHVLDRHWKINQLIDIARQICQGMSYLHDRGIIHRDLKSSNIFLDTCTEPDDQGVCCRVKIGDFGLAAVKTVLAESINRQFQPTGSVLWMAPEVIQQKDSNCYSTSADVYAYGSVLFEMFSGKLPHTPINNKEQIMWLVGKGRLKLKVELCRDDTPIAITNLIRQCTEFDREKRPNFSPEIDDTLSKFECIFPRFQRSQSEPCLIRTYQDDLAGLSIHFAVPKTPVSIHRRFNTELS